MVFRPRTLEVLGRGYRRADFAADISAGLTVSLIALPLALALGIVSLPMGTDTPVPAPAVGIYTAIVAGLIVSLLGGSRVQIGGPTAAFVPIVLLVVERHGYTGLVLATFMAGIILVLMGLTRMGALIKYIPWPVISGFTTGIAVSIIISQMPGILGIEADIPPPREFLEKLFWLSEHAGLIQPAPVILTLAGVAFIMLWPRLGLKRVPGSIVLMLGVTVAIALTGLGPSLGIITVGEKFGDGAIPSGLPPLLIPEINLALIRDLIGPATAIAILGAIESLLSAVVADGLSGDRHDSNTELIAQGIANMVCPFFAGMPATGAVARTSANVANGARTPVAGIVCAMSLLFIVLFCSSYAGLIPIVAMSAVLVAVALRMGEWHELRRLNQMPRGDALVLLTTFGLTVVFDLVIAIEVGMVLAAILFIRRVSETTEVSRVTANDVLEAPEQLAQGKDIPEGVVVYRIFGPFLFGAAEKMEDALLRVGTLPKVLIIRMQLVPVMDATALNAFESLVERMKQSGGSVIISGIHRQPLSLLRKARFIRVIGRRNFCGTFDAALLRARELLGQ